MKTILLKVVLLIATLGMITVNALANILPINNITTATISDSFDIYFVPAGYVFSIWGIIYLLLLGFVVKMLLTKDLSQFKHILPYYVFSTILNTAWIVLWHYGFFLTTVVVMLALLLTLIHIYTHLKSLNLQGKCEYMSIYLPFSVYLSWICVATIANISGILWLFNWNGFGLPGTMWAAIMMAVAGILAIVMIFREKDFAFPLVTIWALVGIMMKFPAQQEMVYVGIISVAAIFLTMIYQAAAELKRNGK